MAENAIAPNVSTFGLGLDLDMDVTDNVSARLSGHTYSYDADGTESGIACNGDLKLRSIGVLADWHPIKNGLRISGGLFLNGNEIKLKATPTANVDIGGTVYTPAQAGMLSSTIDLKSVAPYLGIGWGRAPKGTGLGFNADVGVMFQGAPDASYSSTGTVAAVDLSAGKAQLESELDSFQYYRVVSLGIYSGF